MTFRPFLGLLLLAVSTCVSGNDEAGGKSRPNIVLIVTDQERAPTAYEDERLRSFRSDHLQGYRELGCTVGSGPSSTDDDAVGTSCVKFESHYTSSTACTPSRANLFTGHYATVHGVRLTDGATPLPPDVPTMGHYFEAAGYETRYVGKWHMSHEDLDCGGGGGGGGGCGRPTGRHNDTVDSRAEAEYLDEDPLAKFGFHGWIGPEPHGSARANTGYLRDPQYVRQAVDWIRARSRKVTDSSESAADATASEGPFLLVVNIVNPHDVCLWGLWKMFGFPSTDDTVPHIPAPPTLREDLTTKPTPQSGWKRFGTSIFGGPNWDGDDDHDEFRRFYYYLQKLADEHVATVVRALRDSPFWEDSIVMRTSDHGDTLGAHGLLQKWYSAYEEVLKVPFVVSSPLFPQQPPRTMDFPTSSVDLLPTMLSLAGLNASALQEQLSTRFVETHPLVGVDLSSFLLSNERQAAKPNAVYSSMSDHISLSRNMGPAVFRHSHWVPRLLLKLYHFERDPVEGPTSMEVMVAAVDGAVWKLVRTYDDPALWTFPHQNDTHVKRAGIFAGRGELVVRTVPWAEEWELYHLGNDPYEELNLADKNALKVFGSGPEADRRRFNVQTVQTTLRREMSRLREEKAVRRKTELPKIVSSHANVHLVDMWDIALDRFGVLGPLLLGCFMLARTILRQEPVLTRLLAFACLVSFGIVIAAFLWIVMHVSAARSRNKKVKVS